MARAKAQPRKLRRDAAALPGAPPESFAMFGAPSDDPLAANAQMHAALVVSFFDAMHDGNLSPRERRKELRTISASAAKLLPATRLWQAEQLIKADRREIESKAAAKRGAKLERFD